MTFLYGLLIRAYRLAIGVASLFNPKAKLWITGRRNYFEKLDKLDFSGSWYWIHTASLGEYEQAKPVISELRSKQPDLKFLITFFSPSGYEVRKNDPMADEVLYLPLDTKPNAEKFLKKVNPKLALFVRYEFWPNFMDALAKRNVPTAVMAANFRPEQFMFKPLGSFILSRLKKLNSIMVQTENARDLLLNYDFEENKISVAGNSRIDQVIQISENSESNAIIEKFTANHKTLVLGSCYAQEESFTYKILKENPTLKIILAPHYIDDKNIARLQTNLPVESIRYTEIKDQDHSEYQALILDTMGMLSSIYKYGDFALVGGGFNDGIHSILEPAASHLPLFFGPKHKPFPEAKALINSGGAFEVNSTEEFEKVFIPIYQHEEKSIACSQKIATYMEQQKGATFKIVTKLEKIIN